MPWANKMQLLNLYTTKITFSWWSFKNKRLLIPLILYRNTEDHAWDWVLSIMPYNCPLLLNYIFRVFILLAAMIYIYIYRIYMYLSPLCTHFCYWICKQLSNYLPCACKTEKKRWGPCWPGGWHIDDFGQTKNSVSAMLA